MAGRGCAEKGAERASGGTILAYGTDTKGKQGADKFYEIWDTRSGRHTVASNHGLYKQSTKIEPNHVKINRKLVGEE